MFLCTVLYLFLIFVCAYIYHRFDSLILSAWSIVAIETTPMSGGDSAAAAPAASVVKPDSKGDDIAKEKSRMVNPPAKVVNQAPMMVGQSRTPPAQQGTTSYNGEVLAHPMNTRLNEASRFAALYGDPMYPQGSSPEVHNIMPGDLLFRARVQALSMATKKPTVLRMETSRGVFAAFNGLMSNMRISIAGVADTQYITEESKSSEKTGMRKIAVVTKGVRQLVAGEVFIPQGSRVMWGFPKMFVDPYSKQKRPFIGRVGSELDAFKPVLYPMDVDAYGFGSFCGTVETIFRGEEITDNPLDGPEKTLTESIVEVKEILSNLASLGEKKAPAGMTIDDVMSRMGRLAFSMRKASSATFDAYMKEEFKKEVELMAGDGSAKLFMRLFLLQAEINAAFTEFRESRYVGKALSSGQCGLIDVQVDV